MASLTLNDSMMVTADDKDEDSEGSWITTGGHGGTLAGDDNWLDTVNHSKADTTKEPETEDIFTANNRSAPGWEGGDDIEQAAQLKTQQNTWKAGINAEDDLWATSEPWVDANATDAKRAEGRKSSKENSEPLFRVKAEDDSDDVTVTPERCDSIVEPTPMPITDQSKWLKGHASDGSNAKPPDTDRTGSTRYAMLCCSHG